MDSSSNTKQPSKSSSPNSVPIRVSRSTARHLRSILTKCNRKSHGRKVKTDDVIRRALDELRDDHLEEIREMTYSSQDRLEIEFKKYCQQHGSISKDKFLSLLLSNGLPREPNRHLERSERSPSDSGDPSAEPVLSEVEGLQDDVASASDDSLRLQKDGKEII